jgi:hypothetical protein
MQPYFNPTRKTTPKKNGRRPQKKWRQPQKKKEDNLNKRIRNEDNLKKK